jgi:hypothetical protein
MIGTELARELERLTLALYRFAHDYAASKVARSRRRPRRAAARCMMGWTA